MKELFEWYTIETVGPVRPGRRAGAEEVVRVASPTYKGLWPAVEAYRASIPRAQWPEGHGVYRTRGGQRKRMPGKRTVYYHGPLGWLDSEYSEGRMSHASDCPKCEAIRATLAKLYPWSEEIVVRAHQVARLPSRGRWEQLEAMAAHVPHSNTYSVKWAARP